MYICPSNAAILFSNPGHTLNVSSKICGPLLSEQYNEDHSKEIFLITPNNLPLTRSRSTFPLLPMVPSARNASPGILTLSSRQLIRPITSTLCVLRPNNKQKRIMPSKVSEAPWNPEHFEDVRIRRNTKSDVLLVFSRQRVAVQSHTLLSS